MNKINKILYSLKHAFALKILLLYVLIAILGLT